MADPNHHRDKNADGLRSLSTDAVDVLVEMHGVFDGVGARQSIEVVRVEHLMVRLCLGWQSRRRAHRAHPTTPLKQHVEVVT